MASSITPVRFQFLLKQAVPGSRGLMAQNDVGYFVQNAPAARAEKKVVDLGFCAAGGGRRARPCDIIPPLRVRIIDELLRQIDQDAPFVGGRPGYEFEDGPVRLLFDRIAHSGGHRVRDLKRRLRGGPKAQQRREAYLHRRFAHVRFEVCLGVGKIHREQRSIEQSEEVFLALWRDGDRRGNHEIVERRSQQFSVVLLGALIHRCYQALRFGSSAAVHARMAGRRHACVTGEGDAEGAGRTVAAAFASPTVNCQNSPPTENSKKAGVSPNR
jgi:hypothetical protein